MSIEAINVGAPARQQKLAELSDTPVIVEVARDADQRSASS